MTVDLLLNSQSKSIQPKREVCIEAHADNACVRQPLHKNREERAAPHAETARHLREPQRPHATGRRPRAKLLAADSVNKHDVEALAVDAFVVVIAQLLQQGEVKRVHAIFIHRVVVSGTNFRAQITAKGG